MPRRELRLGVVWSLTSHFPTFACYLNELTDECLKSFSKFTDHPERLEGARIAYAWSEDREELERIAEAHRIEVVDDVSDMVGRVDGALVLTRYPDKNLEYARPFLEAGVPTFIDKPLAPGVETAYEIVRLSREHGTPIMSTSALRYAAELDELRSFVRGRELWGGSVVAPGDFRVENTLYGIHVVEALSSLIGRGVDRVRGREVEGPRGTHVLVEVVYKSGVAFSVHMGSPCYKWVITLACEGASTTVVIENSYEFYRRTISKILEMFRTGAEPVDVRDTLEVVRTCYAVQRSIEEGREVVLDEEFPIPEDLRGLRPIGQRWGQG